VYIHCFVHIYCRQFQLVSDHRYSRVASLCHKCLFCVVVITAEASRASSGSSESDSTMFVVMIVLAALLVVCIIVIIGLVLRHQRTKLRTRRGGIPILVFLTTCDAAWYIINVKKLLFYNNV